MAKTGVKRWIYGAALAALVFVVTFMVRIPVPIGTGAYVNVGDTMIYLGAFFPGGIVAALASGIGSMLCDIVGGAAVYAIPTLIIKFGMCLVCWVVMRKLHKVGGFALGCFAGGAVMAIGYFCTEALLFGLPIAVASIVPNLVQLAAGSVLAIALFIPMSRAISSSKIGAIKI